MNGYHETVGLNLTDEEAEHHVRLMREAERIAKEPVKPSTWLFLDDSGDGGTHPQSTSHLIMSMCMFRRSEAIEHASSIANDVAQRYGLIGEFKFAKTRKKVKDYFFDAMRDADFSIRAIVIDKQLIWSPKYRGNPSMLKAMAISQLLSHGFGQIRNAKVFIDGQDTKAFGLSDAQHFMTAANARHPGSVSQVKFADSKVNRMIQIADMHAGAINAMVRRDKPQLPAYFDTFRHRTYHPEGTLWRFK